MALLQRKMKLTALSAVELKEELKKAGLTMSGKDFDEKEALLRLTTHLIDKGEDPTSYEFFTETSENDKKSDQENSKGLNMATKQDLLDKIVKQAGAELGQAQLKLRLDFN